MCVCVYIYICGGGTLHIYIYIYYKTCGSLNVLLGSFCTRRSTCGGETRNIIAICSLVEP